MAPRRSKRKRGAATMDDAVEDSSSGNTTLTATAPEGYCIFAGLPNELLAMIFEDVAQYDPLASAIRIASVSRAWRAWALANTSLWANASSVCFFPREFHHIKPANVRNLITLCAERSQDRLTHVDLRSLASKALQFSQCMDIVGRSAKTLVELKIGDDALCACRVCDGSVEPDFERRQRHLLPGHGWLWHKHWSIKHIVPLVCQAPKLEAITLEINFGDRSQCCIDAKALASTPTPHSVSLFVNHKDQTDVYIASISVTWLGKLTSQVQDFAFFSKRGDLNAWGWHVFLQRAQHLRRCAIAPPTSDKQGSETVDLPHLQSLTLWGSRYRYQRRVLFNFDTPMLKALRAGPDLAGRVMCPALEAVSLILTDDFEIDALPSLLASWPSLQTLTIELENSEAYEGSDCLRKLISLLSPGICGTVHAPNLRHLGIIYPLYLTSTLFMHQDPRWSALPWTAEETQYRFAQPAKRAIRWRSGNPDLPRGIVNLEAQRRHLSQGHAIGHIPPKGARPSNSIQDAAAAATTLQQPCCALESIKLAGLYVHRDVYSLLLDSSAAQVTCFPDPDASLTRTRKAKAERDED